MTAIYAAAKRPDLVIGLFLVDPPLYAQVGSRNQREAFEQRRALAGKSVEEAIAAGLNQGAAMVSKLDGLAVDYVIDGRAFEGWDIELLLPRIQCPVVLEHGEQGVGTGIAASNIYEGEIERAEALIKNCTVVQIKGSGHIPMAQQPEEFARFVSAFIEGMTHRG
jgi:pimeloyl-ACP methyl ester carboxylesterase